MLTKFRLPPLAFWRERFPRILLMALVAALTFIAIVQPTRANVADIPWRVGYVAPQDVQAPRALEYESVVLTEKARAAAEKNVEPVYSPADPLVARQQIRDLRAALDFIEVIRADEFATPIQKEQDLAALESIRLDAETIQIILSLTSARWDAAAQEALSLLEQSMRTAIRIDTLEVARSGLPALARFDLTEEQTYLAVTLVSQFLTPNSFYSPELTTEAQQSARNQVSLVRRTFVAGEMVVQRGEVLTEESYEALEQFGLIQRTDRSVEWLSAGLLTLTLSILTVFFFLRRRPPLLHNLRGLILVAALFLIFLFVARYIFPDRTIVPYLYPLPAFGLLISTLFGMETAILLSFSLAVLSAYGWNNSLDLTVFYAITSFCSILILGSGRRVTIFFYAALAIFGVGTAIIAAYRLPLANLDWIGFATLALAALVNGVASASLSLLLQFFLAQSLGMITALQLLEISRPDHPLLQYFLRAAPGTYQHSLQVANLAEQAAEAIGADALLVRVGALFHDCGKAPNAPFFIENQLPGNLNPHNDLDPRVAAQTIIGHVTDGVALARKHSLPNRIVDFILEHHGTLITRYQYNSALEAAGGDASKVDESQFRYPGPPPGSRETALLMLADGVEARTRAERPQNEEELRVIVRKVIEFCQSQGQLDNTRLTLRDLSAISESFVTTLRGAYHPRIQYPALEASATEPTGKESA
jgi:cyclic-di-AMP phosphodiesterase PgpH